MLSYALGSFKIKSSVSDDFMDYNSDQKSGKGIFGFLENRENSVVKELDKYGEKSDYILKKLTDVLEENQFNVKMLVAADYFFRGNNNPKIFTEKMFSFKNYFFQNITEISFENKKIWDKDNLTTLLTYCVFLRDNVYNTSSDIKVEEPAEQIFDQFDFGIQNEEIEED